MEDIYIVLMIVLVVWAGIFGYMAMLHKNISDLKARFEEKQSNV